MSRKNSSVREQYKGLTALLETSTRQEIEKFEKDERAPLVIEALEKSERIRISVGFADEVFNLLKTAEEIRIKILEREKLAREKLAVVETEETSHRQHIEHLERMEKKTMEILKETDKDRIEGLKREKFEKDKRARSA